MRKTTVYLDEAEAEALRQLAVATGISQAELIRDAVRQVVSHSPRPRFRSLGKGQSSDALPARWDAAAVYEKAFGRR